MWEGNEHDSNDYKEEEEFDDDDAEFEETEYYSSDEDEDDSESEGDDESYDEGLGAKAMSGAEGDVEPDLESGIVIAEISLKVLFS